MMGEDQNDDGRRRTAVREAMRKLDEVHRDGLETRDKVRKIEEALTGNGSPEKGMYFRLRRLEDYIESQRWFGRMLMTALAAQLVAFLGVLLWFVISEMAVSDDERAAQRLIDERMRMIDRELGGGVDRGVEVGFGK